jgi:hypothetical protein
MKSNAGGSGLGLGLCVAVAVWALVFVVHFSLETSAIRHANSDDVIYDAIAREHTVWSWGLTGAQEQGRFYWPLALGVIAAFFSLDNNLLLACARVLLVLSNVAIVSLLVARLFRNDHLGIGVGIIQLLLLQVPLTFYGILSSPQVGIGFLLTGVVLYWLLGQNRSTGAALLTGSLALAACCLNECFVPVLLLSAAIGTVFSERRRMAAAVLLAIVLYLVAYLTFRYLHPTAYEGVQLSFSLAGWLRAATRYTLSTIPGVELLLNRHGFHEGPLLKSSAEVWQIVRSTRVVSIAWILAGVVLLVRIWGRSTPATSARNHVAFLALLFAIGFCFVLPMIMTSKYQIWSSQRQYPYLYSLYFWYFACAGLVCALHVPRSVRRPLNAALVVVLLLASVATWSSNHFVFRVLERSPYPVPDGTFDDILKRPGSG